MLALHGKQTEKVRTIPPTQLRDDEEDGPFGLCEAGVILCRTMANSNMELGSPTLVSLCAVHYPL